MLEIDELMGIRNKIGIETYRIIGQVFKASHQLVFNVNVFGFLGSFLVQISQQLNQRIYTIFGNERFQPSNKAECEF